MSGPLVPRALALLGEPMAASKTAVYFIGFFLCWALAAVSSFMTSCLTGIAEH